MVESSPDNETSPLEPLNPFKLEELLALASQPKLNNNERQKAWGILRRITSTESSLAGISFYLPDGEKIFFGQYSEVIIEDWGKNFPEHGVFSAFAGELEKTSGRQALPRDLFFLAQPVAERVISYLSHTTSGGKGKVAQESAKLLMRYSANARNIRGCFSRNFPPELSRKCFFFSLWCCLNQPK